MDDIDGELNRRLGVLALLYIQRRTSPSKPEVALMEVEVRMGFPRDYLEFTTWYLQKKGFITRADNSDFALTAEGVDFVEAQRGNIPVLNKLLTSGIGSSIADSAAEDNASHPPRKAAAAPAGTEHPVDRRSSSPDRRSNPAERGSK
jgi:hypothetical protein